MLAQDPTLEEDFMEFGFMRSGIFTLTRDEYLHSPIQKINRFMGFFEGIQEKDHKMNQDQERARWRNNG